jgi:O-acetylhomoserine (thiol)-lyase
VVHPSSTIFAHSSEEEKQAAGVYDDQIRISVGIEDIRDLIADFDQALSAEE